MKAGGDIYALINLNLMEIICLFLWSLELVSQMGASENRCKVGVLNIVETGPSIFVLLSDKRGPCSR